VVGGAAAAADLVFELDLDDKATSSWGMEVNVAVEGDFGSVREGERETEASEWRRWAG
jgi:hypothetical protein